MKNRGRSYNQEHENHSGRNSKRWPEVKRSGKPLSLQDAFDSNIVTCNKRNKAMLEGEGQKERGEAIDEIGLDEGLVGVPHAVEETLPELLGVVVGEGLGLRREP